jgi:hypothetical protein
VLVAWKQPEGFGLELLLELLELLPDPELDVEVEVDASSPLAEPDELPEGSVPLDPFEPPPGEPPEVPGSLEDPFDDG